MHLIKNLDYFNAEGRLTVIETLGNLFTKMPSEIKAKHSELLFFSMMLRCSVDGKSECQRAAWEVGKKIIAKTDGD